MSKGIPIAPERIERAIELFLSPQSPYRAARKLRDEFDVSLRTAYRYLALAAKRCGVAFASISPEQRRAQVEGLLFDAMGDAEVQNVITGQPNASAKVAAISKLADVYGLATKVEVDAKVTGLGDLLGAVLADAGSGAKGA